MRGRYSHRLATIDAVTSHALLDEVVHGCCGIKPGWILASFNYFISETSANASSTSSI
ncbi:hypothetical protein ACWDG1_48375 [Streptomyces sp. NPDC001177]